jgi:phospholipase C
VVGGGRRHPPFPPPPPAKIQHVVIIFQENRTPDNLFQDPVLIRRGADIVQQGTNSIGQTVALAPISLVTNYDLSHTHAAYVKMYDNGKMDGADLIPVFCPPGSTNCPPANPPFAFVNPSEVQPYFSLAETYTFGDRMFQTNQGPSFPAHQFMLAGTSASTETSTLFVAENTIGVPLPGDNAGCTAPAAVGVRMIETTDPNPQTNETQFMYPCFDHPTLTDLLNARNLSWKYYAPAPGSIWTAPNAVKHMCVPDSTGTNCTGKDWIDHVVINPPQVLTDISSGQLPAVSWVIPDGKASDHALSNEGSGPSWVASVVNAIGTSQYWANTAIIITWDDWGGWYDHVAPPQLSGNSYEYGFRVPLIVVSPYAKPGYISHVTHDFGSVLKFIESVFGLPTIDPAVGYADSRADDLSDCFDFNQSPLSFKAVPAKRNADYFLNDTRPPTDPDDD